MDKLKSLESEHAKAMEAHMRKMRGASFIMTALVCISGPIAISISGSAVIGVITVIAALAAMFGVMTVMRKKAEVEITMNAVRREEILDEMK